MANWDDVSSSADRWDNVSRLSQGWDALSTAKGKMTTAPAWTGQNGPDNASRPAAAPADALRGTFDGMGRAGWSLFKGLVPYVAIAAVLLAVGAVLGYAYMLLAPLFIKDQNMPPPPPPEPIQIEITTGASPVTPKSPGWDFKFSATPPVPTTTPKTGEVTPTPKGP